MDKKRVLFLVNHEVVIYNFRLELVERLIADGYEVHISSPYGPRIEKLINLGAVFHDISIERHGMNPILEHKIVKNYQQLFDEVKPVVVFGYTIKPNIYGAYVAHKMGIPFVANITGLGSAVENGGLKQLLTILMYKASFGTKKGKIQRVFFQNEQNMGFFREKGIAVDVHDVLCGSGVNVDRFPAVEYPECGDGIDGKPICFAFISRIMKEKGIEQYLDAAQTIRTEFPNTEFHIAGFFEPEYDRNRLDDLCKKNVVIYDGNIEDVSGYMGMMHCIIHPTYYPEGLSNVLLEASSTGRPIITCDRPGCSEVVFNSDGFSNGFLVKAQDSEELVDTIRDFICMPWNDKKAMGLLGRQKVKKHFNRNNVIDKYLKEVHLAEKYICTK